MTGTWKHDWKAGVAKPRSADTTVPFVGNVGGQPVVHGHAGSKTPETKGGSRGRFLPVTKKVHPDYTPSMADFDFLRSGYGESHYPTPRARYYPS